MNVTATENVSSLAKSAPVSPMSAKHYIKRKISTEKKTPTACSLPNFTSQTQPLMGERLKPTLLFWDPNAGIKIQYEYISFWNKTFTLSK